MIRLPIYPDGGAGVDKHASYWQNFVNTDWKTMRTSNLCHKELAKWGAVHVYNFGHSYLEFESEKDATTFLLKFS